ncbi:hypothetical protein ACHAW6_000552 [Cyclotella cf. meneghiniana]
MSINGNAWWTAEEDVGWDLAGETKFPWRSSRSCRLVRGGRGGWDSWGFERMGGHSNMLAGLIGFGILFTTLGMGVLENGDNREVQLWQVVYAFVGPTLV